MASKKRKPTNYYRLSIQWIVVILLTYMVIHPFYNKQYTPDFEAYCPFGGMQALSSFLFSDILACSMSTTQITMGLALMIAAILFSKLFCSYVCPIGTFSEWLGKIGDALKIRYTIKGNADRILRLLKYGLLFLTFYFTISSGELFCKQYDPYYALFSVFSSDVVILYAVITIAVMVIGAVFIRLFWCKYLCPLSAATNIFSNFLVFAIITGFWLLLLLVFHVNISWVWYLGAVCLSGFLFEALLLKSYFFPLLKITRDITICTDCKKCDKACPYAIRVSEPVKLNHIDCTMCGDCITQCPEKGTLKINRHNLRWLPPVAVVILVAASIYFSSTYELPTINQRWGTELQMKTAQEFTMTGLKNIKCYGSSMSFATQMREVPGVLGVETFVKTHTIKIFYDAAITGPEKLKAAIFSPTSNLLHQPASYKSNVAVLHFGLNNYFDDYDAYDLNALLSDYSDIYAIETSFGEPVQTTLYYNPKKYSPEQIQHIIEQPSYVSFSDGEKTNNPINFKVVKMDKEPKSINAVDFISHFIQTYDSKFNKYDSYKENELSEYKIAMPQAAEITKVDSIAYLVSSISTDNGIVRFSTNINEDGVFAFITFVKNKTTEEKIYKELNIKLLNILYDDGTREMLNNPFNFKSKGIVIDKKNKFLQINDK